MPKIINLDELIPETQQILLDGAYHDLLPSTVEMYLRVMQDRKRLSRATTEVEQTEEAIKLILLCAPTLSRDRLMSLPIKALMRLTDAIQEQMAEGVDVDGLPTGVTDDEDDDAGE